MVVVMCNKKQICNVCGAPFKMERGCNLEKRCLPCRLLKLQANGDGNRKLMLPKEKVDSACYNYAYGEDWDIAYDDRPTVEQARDLAYLLHKVILPSLRVPDKENFNVFILVTVEEYSFAALGIIYGVTRARIRERYNSGIRLIQHGFPLNLISRSYR